MHARAPGYQHLDTSNVAAARTVQFLPSKELTSGSRQKADQAIRLVRANFRQRFNCVVKPGSSGVSIECPEAAETDILELCDVVEQKLGRLRREPLTAKMVQEILSISSAELRRWSKDGRMPTAGRAFFGQGQKQVSLFLYSPDVIRGYAARPERIADWRRRDREIPAFHSQSSPAR